MASDESQPRKKRKWIGMTVVLGIFLALVIATVVIGEKLAGDFAAGLIKDQVASALGVEDSDDVSVEFGGGPLLAQALGGSLDEVIITVDDAALGPASGDLRLVASGVPLSLDGAVSTMTATVSFDPAAVQALAPTLTDAPVTAVTTEGTDLVLTSAADVGGAPVPVTVSLTPSAAESLVVFAVAAITANGQPLDVAQVQAGAYGPGAAQLGTPRALCLAGYLPAAFTLADAHVSDGLLTVAFTGTKVNLAGGGLGTKGECPQGGAVQ